MHEMILSMMKLDFIIFYLRNLILFFSLYVGIVMEDFEFLFNLPIYFLHALSYPSLIFLHTNNRLKSTLSDTIFRYQKIGILGSIKNSCGLSIRNLHCRKFKYKF